jgi:hypothetical protein
MIKIPQSKTASKEQRTAVRAPGKHTAKKGDRVVTIKAAPPRKSGKLDKVIAMMCRPKGATIVELSNATDWQAHSVPGAISGTIKKKHGLKVVSEKSGDVRTYRIAG